jgi:hypothetical protein
VVKAKREESNPIGPELFSAFELKLLTPKDLLNCCRKSQPQSSPYALFLRNETGDRDPSTPANENVNDPTWFCHVPGQAG